MLAAVRDAILVGAEWMVIGARIEDLKGISFRQFLSIPRDESMDLTGMMH